MEALRRLFGKSRPKDKPKPSKKKESTTNGKEGAKVLSTEEVPSNATKQKVAAAKQYIEKHYKEQMKSLQERRERYGFYVIFLGNCSKLFFKLYTDLVLTIHLVTR